MSKKAVLLIGFGGPRSLQEVQPFLMSIVQGTKIPQSRIDEVYHHYEVIGGKSRFNEITELQQKALQQALRQRGLDVPVGVAYRHSTPTFEDAMGQFKRYGVDTVVGFILASFRSFVSREWYRDKVEEGRQKAQADIRVVYTDAFDLDPLYLEAQADRIGQLWGAWNSKTKDETLVIFTAHSIPAPMCEQSTMQNDSRCYGFQFGQASERIARAAGAEHWTNCYQSRSGNPRDPWLEPDIKDVVRSVDTARFKNVLLVPVGFLCDNVEVIYDLDHEAKRVAEEKGLNYFRASTVSDHPKFIQMMADQIQAKL